MLLSCRQKKVQKKSPTKGFSDPNRSEKASKKLESLPLDKRLSEFSEFRRGAISASSSLKSSTKASKAFTITSPAFQSEKISSYETGTTISEERRCVINGKQSKPMSLEKIFFEEIQPQDQASTLEAVLGMEQIAENPPMIPISEENFQISEIAPKGKKILLNKDWNFEIAEEENQEDTDFIQNMDIEMLNFDHQNLAVNNQDFGIEMPILAEQENDEFREMWNVSLENTNFNTTNEDEMMLINPLEAEGVQVQAENSDNNAQENPFLVSENPFLVSNEVPDLLKMVMDDTLAPEDSTFQEFVQVEVSPKLETIDLGALVGPSTSHEQIQIKEEPDEDYNPPKRGRGRPRLPRTVYAEPLRYTCLSFDNLGLVFGSIFFVNFRPF